VIFFMASYQTIPFHFIWVSLTLLYGFRPWNLRTTAAVLVAVIIVTSIALGWAAAHSEHGYDELAEIPMMAAMFVAMVWHARRREAARREVERMAVSEHRLREAESAFVRDASHELRTPITIARGHLELAHGLERGNEQALHSIDIALDELNRLSQVSERLLILAAAAHPDFIRLSPMSVDQLVEDTVGRWSVTARRQWQLRIAANGAILGDRDRLECALDALVENAVKSTHEEDRIVVAARAEGDSVVIEVADTGEGIPPDQLGRIFDRFARVQSDRGRRNGGTGLGLPIVKAIAEAHGGSVEARSVPREGATFSIRLPKGRQ
jgi:signal transduction histidine kinase